jgi:hypothetical protein
MKPILTLSVLAVLLAVAPNRSYALELIDTVTTERAKALGLQFRAEASGPDAVRVWLEFEKQGELERYLYVVLEVKDGEKLLSDSELRERKSRPGRVVVSFVADRAKLAQFTLRVVEQTSASRVGHVMRVKDFVDLDKLR